MWGTKKSIMTTKEILNTPEYKRYIQLLYLLHKEEDKSEDELDVYRDEMDGLFDQNPDLDTEEVNTVMKLASGSFRFACCKNKPTACSPGDTSRYCGCFHISL